MGLRFGMNQTPVTGGIKYQPTPPSAAGKPNTYQAGLDYANTPVKTGNPLFDEMPTPGYTIGWDRDTMGMESKYKELQPQFSQGYNQFKEEATNKGPSAWANLTSQKNNMEAQGQRESAGRSANAGIAESLSRLASGGGLSSGARERAVESGVKNKLGMQQDITRQNMLNNLSTNIQDQSNHQNMLSQLPGMENQRLSGHMNAMQGDVNNQMGEAGNLNEYNKYLYGMRMSAAAAEREAQAMKAANAGSPPIDLPGIGRTNLGRGQPGEDDLPGWFMEPIPGLPNTTGGFGGVSTGAPGFGGPGSMDRGRVSIY